MLQLATSAVLAAVVAGTPIEDRGGPWEATLEEVVPAVVVLRLSNPRAFDTEGTGASTATGFVVDAERGIILTNRHVVSPGPVVAEAVFQNNEEVEVHALYRDPVHDFGFFRFDPDEVRFMNRAELTLAPHRARVGTEVRVIGNDAGEKLSILGGTLARLDRRAPTYGRGRYNDFNTFYYQAASNTSGGSSGSPVIDRRGRVVAINAGGKTRAASSYYLPLDRVVRALDLIREGRPVTRGTLQATFQHEPYDELRRLGLPQETEAASRDAHPDAIGMLVVDQTVPGGPADGILQPGDILVAVEGERVTDFLPLEAALDDRVGGSITLDVERGGASLRLSVEVQDLHAITPRSYLEVGGGILNELSYQQARSYAIPASGVFVASSGYMLKRAGIPRGAVITQVGGTPTPGLDAFEAAVGEIADGERVPFRYFRVQMQRTKNVAVVTVDRRWHPMQRCTRDDNTGSWPCVASPGPPAPDAAAPNTTAYRDAGDRRTRKLARSLAMVSFHVPYRVDGVHGDSFVGFGLVVDAARGLVVVDRDTVPVAMGDATLTFAGSVEVPGEVVYLHPIHNVAVLRYDPLLLGDTPVRSADLHTRSFAAGDELWLVALSESQQLLSEKVTVSRVETAALPLTQPPRYRESNLDLVALTRAPSTVGGVLADRRGRVVAQWASFSSQGREGPTAFFAGIPVGLLEDVVEPLREGRPVALRTLGVELRPLSLAEARNRGLSESAARRIEEHDPERRLALSVLRLAADAPAAGILEEGDLLVAVNGEPATRVRAVERAAQMPDVAVSVLRDGEELELQVPTLALPGVGTERAVVWAGALLQAPHRSVAVQRGIPREGVYVAWYAWGSPAHRYGLGATRRITAVDGSPTADLDGFLAAVADRPDRGSVRLRTVDLEGRVDVITLKLDLRYWPTTELVLGDAGWERLER